MEDQPYKAKTAAYRKLNRAKRDWPLMEVVITILLIVVVWALDIFVVQRSYDRKYFQVVQTARQSVTHCRDMVVNRVRPDVYRVLTCNKAYFYRVSEGKVRLVEVRSQGEAEWAN